MALPDSRPQDNLNGGPTPKGPPKSLRLAFSEAADYKRINVFFDPAVKGAVDPSHYITKRKENAFKNSVAKGCVAFLSDENQDVMILAIAYQVHTNDNHAPGAPHDYTEIATAMSRLRDYRNADLLLAALSLKEWWTAPPKNLIMASVDNSNQAPQHISQVLGCDRVTDPETIEKLFYAVYKTVVDDTGQNRDVPLPPEEEKAKVWFYACLDRAIATQAAVVLKFMDAGGVTNKKTNDFIPVDFSALSKIGLTRARLEAIAQGDLSRGPLKKVKPPAP